MMNLWILCVLFLLATSVDSQNFDDFFEEFEIIPPKSTTKKPTTKIPAKTMKPTTALDDFEDFFMHFKDSTQKEAVTEKLKDQSTVGTTPTTRSVPVVKTVTQEIFVDPPDHMDLAEYMSQFQKANATDLVESMKTKAFNKCATDLLLGFLNSSNVDPDAVEDCKAITESALETIISSSLNEKPLENFVNGVQNSTKDCDLLNPSSCLQKAYVKAASHVGPLLKPLEKISMKQLLACYKTSLIQVGNGLRNFAPALEKSCKGVQLV